MEVSFAVWILREVPTGKEKLSHHSNVECIADVCQRIARDTYFCSMSAGHTI